jgi:RNA polymerase sigma-70 factor (ECF subfamily)
MDEKRSRFEAEVLPHLDSAYRYALVLTRSRADAQDLVQESIMRAWRHQEGLRLQAKAWLMTIVRNCFLTSRAHPGRASTVSLSEVEPAQAALQLVAPMADPQDHAIRSDQQRSLERLLARLDREHREVLVLREIEDLSYREIAEVAGLPIGTVMSRLARARQALKDLWLDEHGEGTP